MNRLISLSGDLVNRVPMNFSRFLYNNISMRKRITGIFGGNGLGKSTLLLQLIRNLPDRGSGVLFARVDDIYFSCHALLEFAGEFYRSGGVMLFLDDLHKYLNAQKELESIHREMPELRIVFSSTVDFFSSDLPDQFRQEMELHHLPGLSYREFLEFRYQFAFTPIQFDELLELNRNPGINVLNRIRPLQYFSEYLYSGYYSFREETSAIFQMKLDGLVNSLLESDLSAAYNMDNNSINKVRRLLAGIALGGPFKPNIEKLAEEVGTSRDSLLKFLSYTDKAGLTTSIYGSKTNGRQKPKPYKIYLDNSNLVPALSYRPCLPESLYETFLVSQLKYGHKLWIDKGDNGLIVDEEFSFSLEWINQGLKRSAGSAYSINPDLDYQKGTRIPLWMFGFLY